MSKNYYEILQVGRTATDVEINESYRRLAIKWHPSKHRDNLSTAQYMFNEIAEAFDVLSDKNRRAAFD